MGFCLLKQVLPFLVLANGEPTESGPAMPFYAAGFFSLAVGMFLIWKEPLSALMIGDETSPDGTVFMPKLRLLGRIDLNGYYLEAYEEKPITSVGVSACDLFLRSIWRAKQVLFAT